MIDGWINDTIYEDCAIVRSKGVLLMGGHFWGQLVAEDVCIGAISLRQLTNLTVTCQTSRPVLSCSVEVKSTIGLAHH